MPSYRFCRPDDLGLIVKAYNACYRLHYPDTPLMTEDLFKEQMTLFDVRPGNCLVALERQQPVGIVVSTKRDHSGWIQAIGCLPTVQRQGIGAQLIEALVRKIAIQRTNHITVDVPADHSAAVAFFSAVGFAVEGSYTSYQGSLPAHAEATHAVKAVPAPEALTWYATFHTVPACWERSAASLAAYGTVLQGYVYSVQGAVQGYLLHRGAAILDLALAAQANASQVTQALLQRLYAAGFVQARVAKVPAGDTLNATLAGLGFTAAEEFLLMGQALG